VLSAMARCAQTPATSRAQPQGQVHGSRRLNRQEDVWAGNQSITSEQFEALYQDFLSNAEGKSLFAQDLSAAPILVGSRLASSPNSPGIAVIRTLLIRPRASELGASARAHHHRHAELSAPIPNVTAAKSENVVAIGFRRKIVLIGGLIMPADEEVVFTTLNYYLPRRRDADALLANVGPKGDAAIFFGLSGPGKTTLSPTRSARMIGDDEHGWGPDGVFHFEGGLLRQMPSSSPAKPSRDLRRQQRFGAVLENCVLDPNTREVDFDDGSKTENTRSAIRSNSSRTLAHRPRAAAEERGDAGRRRLWRAPPIAKN